MQNNPYPKRYDLTPALSGVFYRSMDGLGIPDAHFHDLRRTFGYNFVKQEIPIYQVSKLLSHASVATTEKPL
jgi:integrase|tara:strand:- start:3456 stop:3671 length:216 start_codon:yes stop_codon:yes gene_type:complete